MALQNDIMDVIDLLRAEAEICHVNYCLIYFPDSAAAVCQPPGTPPASLTVAAIGMHYQPHQPHQPHRSPSPVAEETTTVVKDKKEELKRTEQKVAE